MGDRRMLLTDPLDGELKTIITLLDSETTDETTSDAIRVGDGDDITFFITYDGTITGGELVIESAETEDYSGTWVNEGNSTGASNATDRVVVRGIVEWIRARINAAITGGGSVTVKMAVKGAVRS